MANKKNKRISRKKKFQGNQFQRKMSTPTTKPSQSRKRLNIEDDTRTPLSTHGKKIKLCTTPLRGKNEDFFYFFMDFRVLKSIMEVIGKCPECGSASVTVYNCEEKRMGLSLNLKLLCSDCDWSHDFFTSQRLENDGTPGPNSHCINVQTVLAFREIGKGYEAIRSFFSCMNMPPPMSPTVFSSINGKLHQGYKKVSDACLTRAANDIRSSPVDENAVVEDVQVAIDGTWQKRGHASLNGVVVATSSKGKVLDYQVLTKHCKECQIWDRWQGTAKYDSRKASHSCKINHKGSAGAMEAAGAISIFQQSVDKHRLRYTKYLGDGDTESFSKVVGSNPYGSVVAVKLECVGHIQKRLGTRLRKLRNEYKGKRLDDGKQITGKGRLTDKCINTMQNYFGIAIRQNKENLYAMKKATGAVLYHCSDIENKNARHQFCPRTVDG